MRYLLLLALSLQLYSSTLHLATSSNPARLNPLLATDSSSSEIANFIFNSLVKYDKDSSTIIPDLAKKFYFKDNKTLVFELKKGVKWHDGEEFSAKDVLFTYKTIISKNIVSPYSSSFRFVKDVLIINPYKIEVHYKKVYFKALETWTMGIIPEHILRDEKNLMSSDFNKKPIGTGAYRLKKLEHNANIILEAFEDYFEGKPKIDTISFHIIADSMTRFLMLKSLKLDLGSIEPMTYERGLDTAFRKNFTLYETMSHSYTYLGFNLRLKKFQDPRVREALSLAIDRQEIIDILFFGHAKVCYGPFLPSIKLTTEKKTFNKRNLLRAKELLRLSGYTEKNPLSFEITTSNSNAIRPYTAEIIQHQLKKIGVKVSLKTMEWQAFLNTAVFPHKFDTVLLGWSLSPTPDPYLTWHSESDKKSGFNFIGYHNKKVDKLIEKTQSTVDREKLTQLWGEISKSVVSDNPYLFLFIPNSITALNAEIKNVSTSPSGIWHNYIQWSKQ